MKAEIPHRLPLATKFLSVAALISVFACSALAQDQSQYDHGTPPQQAAGSSAIGSYISSDLGTVNLSNGSLNFKLPLGSVGGRGFSLPLTLNYSNKVWSAILSSAYDPDQIPHVNPVVFAVYDDPAAAPEFYQRVAPGWTLGAAPMLRVRGMGLNSVFNSQSGCDEYVKALTKLTLILPDKGEIELRDDATDGEPLGTGYYSTCRWMDGNRGQRWHATDGSGLIFISDAVNGVVNGNLNGVVITGDGTRYRFADTNSSFWGSTNLNEFARASSVTDRHGNILSITYPSGLSVLYTDQLGRTTRIDYGAPDPDNPSQTLAVLVTLPGYTGQNRYYKIKTGTMNQHYRAGINPTLPVINGDSDPLGYGYSQSGPHTSLFPDSYGSGKENIDNREVLTELVLPDGRSLAFNYNEYGEVAEVVLPTGGRVQYDYAYTATLPSGNSATWEVHPTPPRIPSDVHEIDRAVVARRSYADGSTLESSWSYIYSAAIGVNSEGATATNAYADVQARAADNTLLLNQRHYFLEAGRFLTKTGGTGYSLWSTGVERRTETRDAANTVIAASEEDWSQRTPVVWSYYASQQIPNDNRVNEARKILDDGSMAKVDTSYQPTVKYNNPIEVQEFDFDQSLKRRTTTTYADSANLINGLDYTSDSIRLLHLPLVTTVYDAGNNQAAQSVNEYDNYASDGNHAPLQDYGSVTQHDANYGASYITRGNLTRAGRWVNVTNSFIYSYPRYDDLGNVVAAKDANGNVASISFADDFGNGSNPGGGASGTNGATYALPTLITSPPPTPGAPAHTARSQYDFSTGLMTGFKDRNGTITQTIYNDAFDRPTQVKSALGISGVESHAAIYYAPATAFGITLTNNDVLSVKDQTTLDDAVLRSWTKTDGFGRTIEGWSKDPQGDVRVVTNFDALGRTKQVSNPFRPSLGETAVYTTSAYDMTSRVVSITTPDSAVVTSSYSGKTVTVTDQAGKQRKSVTDALGRLKEVYEDPNGLNYLTSYSYDTLDNLTGVSQIDPVTQYNQTRTFAYDSLKRLTSATNPESGTICYGTVVSGQCQADGYDGNGNLRFRTDARGISTEYRYDSLNRVTVKLYRVGGQPDPNTGDVEYLYDNATNGKGRLWLTLTWGANRFQSVVGNYDALGRITQLHNIFGNGQGGWYPSYDINHTYDLAGHVLTQTYPSGRIVTSAYDSGGRTNSVTGNLGDGRTRTYSAGIIYSSMGGMTKEQFGTATPIYNKLFYNVRGQLSEIRESTSYTGPTDTTWDRGAIINNYSNNCSGMCSGQSMTDNNGNLKKQEVYIPGSDTFAQFYEYDSLNRLQKVNESKNGAAVNWQQQYVYDRFGNRTIDQTNTWGAGVPKPNFGVDTATNRLTAPAGYSMSYDAAGNLTNDTFTGEGARVYDAENRMKQAWSNNQWQTYTYDGDGRRLKRSVNGTETWQVYGLDGELLAEYAANAAASSPQKEYGYRNGQLLVTAEAGSGSGGGPQPVTWTNAVGVTVNGNNLTKTAAEGWTNAGAASTQSIASGDGYVECTATETTTYRMIGLNNGDPDQSYATIDYALYPIVGGGLQIYENGSLIGNFGSYNTGDVLRVAVEGGVVKYRRNGTLLYTSTVAPSYPLLADTSLYSPGATLNNVVISSGATGEGGAQNVTWTSAVNVTASGNNLTRTGNVGPSQWSGGASSTQSIASGDGYVEFLAGETNRYRLCGLSHGDTDQNYSDVDFALMEADGGILYVTENGTLHGVGGYTTGDVLRVAVEGGAVKYRKNGTLLYTSTISPTYPLLVDTSLYDNDGTLTNVVISSGSGGGGSSSAQIHWLVADQLGTPRMVFDQTGSLANISRHDYLPFGEEIYAGTGGRTTAQGYTLSDNVRQKFTQKERDNETGLDYSINRYYSSTQGRFTGVDPLAASGRLIEPQSLNRYVYALNNPLLYVDPDGLDWYINESTREVQWYKKNAQPNGYTPFTPPNNRYNISDTQSVILNQNGPNPLGQTQEEIQGWGYAAHVDDGNASNLMIAAGTVTVMQPEGPGQLAGGVLLGLAILATAFALINGNSTPGALAPPLTILPPGISRSGPMAPSLPPNVVVPPSTLPAPPIVGPNSYARKRDLDLVDHIADEYGVDRHALGNLVEEVKRGLGRYKGRRAPDLTKGEIEELAKELKGPK